MFSALKRLTKSDSAGGDSSSSNNNAPTHDLSRSAPPKSLPSALQKKFAKGVQYNMKIILKGDHSSGKSTLYRRLQGFPFSENYEPTDEIQVANIHWNYKTHDDVVKVEIWDVVDRAKTRKSFGTKLKIDNSSSGANNTSPSAGAGDDPQQLQQEGLGLDATFLDVYKSTNGVIFLYDVTKPWTFDYVKREIVCVPKSIPILILANHRDKGCDPAVQQQLISPDTAVYFIEGLEREEGAAEIRFSESSMKNGFGLKLIHKFFNLPFLQLQRETLLQQLETNRIENEVTLQELDLWFESPEANYDSFLELLGAKKRGEVAPAAPSVLVENHGGVSRPHQRHQPSQQQQQQQVQDVNRESISNGTKRGPATGAPVAPRSSPSFPEQRRSEPAPMPSPSAKDGASNGSRKTQKSDQSLPKKQAPSTTAAPAPVVPGLEAAAFDFNPGDTGVDNSFFQDDNPSSSSHHSASAPRVQESTMYDDQSSGEEDNNPMVTSYVEDIVPEQYVKSSYTSISGSVIKKVPAPAPVSSSDDDDN